MESNFVHDFMWNNSNTWNEAYKLNRYTIGIDGIGFKTRFYFVNFMIDWLIVNKDVLNAVVRVDTAHHMNGVSYRFCKTSTIVEMLEDILNTIIFYLIDIRKHVVKNNMPFVHVNEAEKKYTKKMLFLRVANKLKLWNNWVWSRIFPDDSSLLFKTNLTLRMAQSAFDFDPQRRIFSFSLGKTNIHSLASNDLNLRILFHESLTLIKQNLFKYKQQRSRRIEITTNK